jgi:hypothetical protein
MISINLGIVSCENVQPHFAYGVVRSTFLPLDAAFLAVQGFVLGALFGNPILGAKMGAMMACTDRGFSPFINQFVPGRCHQTMSLPLGTKNITLAGASIATAHVLLKLAHKYFFKS